MIPNPWHKDVRLLETRLRVLARQGMMPTTIADILMIPRDAFAGYLKQHPQLIMGWRHEVALFFAERFRKIDVLAFGDANNPDDLKRVEGLSRFTLMAGMDNTARRGYQAIWLKMLPTVEMDRIMLDMEQEARGSTRSTWAEIALSARETLRAREEETYGVSA